MAKKSKKSLRTTAADVMEAQALELQLSADRLQKLVGVFAECWAELSRLGVSDAIVVQAAKPFADFLRTMDAN